MKYFNNVTSYKNLKDTYRNLLIKNHPDNGGDTEIMSEINIEYEAAFRIWKNKDVNITDDEKNETAAGTIKQFYTQNGWAGSNYNGSLSLKEIAQIVRAYIKEKYPTCKFSVRTSYASMCQELHVAIKEFPEKMYKTGADLINDGLYNTVTYENKDGKICSYEEYKPEINEMLHKISRNGYFNRDSWTESDLIQAYENAIKKDTFYAIPTEYFKSVVDDVDALVNSYNYEDCDGMIDYFDVNFYYFGCKTSDCVQVNKTPRIKNKENKPATVKEAAAIDTTGDSYTITPSKHTKTGAQIWLVKWLDTLSRDEYITLNNKIKTAGGYYSKFTHSFIFSVDPTDILKTI